MSSIFLPDRHIVQPQGRLELSPEFDNVGAALVLNAGSVYDPASGKLFTGTGSTIVGTNGLARRFNGAQFIDTGATSLGGVNLFASSGNPFSFVTKFRTASVGGTGTILARASITSAAKTLHLVCNGTGQDPNITVRGSSTLFGWDFDDTKWHTVTFSFDGAAAVLYGDGSKSGPVTVGTAAEETSEPIVVGARTSGTGFFLTGDVEFVYLFRGALTQNQHLALHENPYQLFRASPRRLYFDVPAGGGITGTLSVTETGSDTASLSGIVLVQGTVSTTENTSDVLSCEGIVLVSGSVAATETTVDIFAASGGSGAITGTLSVTETGPDVFSCSGTILVSGSLTATESTSDTLSISGVVLISGSLAATEGTSDIFSATNVAPAANKTVNSKWLVSLGSTGGTVQLQMASEVNGVNVTLQDGLLFLKYRKI